MPKIMTFDKATCAIVRERVVQLLAPLKEEFGIAIKPAGGSFSPGAFTMKVEMAVVSADGNVETPEAQAFRMGARMLGMEATDLGREFVCQGRRFKIAGYRARSSKRPIAAIEVETGKQYVFEISAVKSGLVAP